MNLKVIYEPKGPAGEYAKLALNLYNGCIHGCKYCYNNTRWNKDKFFDSAKPRTGLTSKIEADARSLSDEYGDACPEILISFIGDAYQPAEKHLGITRLAIRTLINHNLPFTILTKSNLITRDFDLLQEHRKKFRLGMSLITTDDFKASEWEPKAASVLDRIYTLGAAKKHGFQTWVSLEPVIWPAEAVRVINSLYHLVDFWWIGKLNHMKPPEPVNWIEAMRDIQAELEAHKCKYRFKKSFTEL